ncbi:hypothetical protein Y1Q_0012123 [Alligator mississippiensis]|uniref:Secreted protein n=1 Tax=Alligator mississippiensis TaxID=8496 RepID=A0A151P5M8_ALLMI|nr:hypothetical protein Y1Q_0012123 [Alligator mississippiensis]
MGSSLSCWLVICDCVAWVLTSIRTAAHWASFHLLALCRTGHMAPHIRVTEKHNVHNAKTQGQTFKGTWLPKGTVNLILVKCIRWKNGIYTEQLQLGQLQGEPRSPLQDFIVPDLELLVFPIPTAQAKLWARKTGCDKSREP